MSALEAYLCQNVALLSDVRSPSIRAKRNRMFFFIVVVIKSLTELENEHQKLNLLLFWYENENVFWKWMVKIR